MVKCSFCNKTISPGTGLIYAKNDGRLLYFDRKKCEKNMLKLKRNPAKVNWVRKPKKIKDFLGAEKPTAFPAKQDKK